MYNFLYIYIHRFIVFIEKIRILICNLLYLIVVGRRGEERDSLSQLLLFPIVVAQPVGLFEIVERNRGSKKMFIATSIVEQVDLAGGRNVQEADRQ